MEVQGQKMKDLDRKLKFGTVNESFRTKNGNLEQKHKTLGQKIKSFGWKMKYLGWEMKYLGWKIIPMRRKDQWNYKCLKRVWDRK